MLRIDVKLTLISDDDNEEKFTKAPAEKELSIIIPTGEKEKLREAMSTLFRFVAKSNNLKIKKGETNE